MIIIGQLYKTCVFNNKEQERFIFYIVEKRKQNKLYTTYFEISFESFITEIFKNGFLNQGRFFCFTAIFINLIPQPSPYILNTPGSMLLQGIQFQLILPFQTIFLRMLILFSQICRIKLQLQFLMKVHQYLTNKPLNVPAAPKSKQDNCFGRGTLFEVKELQIESKHDVEDWQPDQEKKIIDAEMCQSIVPEPPEETFSALHEPEMEKVKTSLVDGEGGDENLTNRGIINRNYSRENEIIGDERSMNILLNKQDSNINYLAMQTKQMLRLTQYSILCKEEKELKSKISMLEIACRKLKIAIRGTSKKKSPPLDRSPLSKLQIEKQRQLTDYIKKEKATYHKHKTKLLLLNNYLQKKNQQIAFMPTTTDDLQIQPSIIQHENIKFVCEKTSKISEFGQYYMSLSKHRQVLKDRIAVMKDSILLTQKYTAEKIQRSIKENSILRQEIEIMNTEINKIQRQKRRVVKRRSETVERVKSLKLVRRREGDSQNSAHEKKDIFKNNSYYLRRPSKILSRQQHLKKPKNDYSNDFESFSDKKFGKKESQIKEQEENKIQMKRMQEYIAGQYFQQRLSTKNEEVNL